MDFPGAETVLGAPNVGATGFVAEASLIELLVVIAIV